MPVTTSEMLSVIAQWAATVYPHPPSKICIHFHGMAEPVCLPLTPAAPVQPARPFEPNEMQDAILECLDGKCLRTDALATASGYDRRKLFRKPGGLAELQEQGLVANDPARGYYRPDAPGEAV